MAATYVPTPTAMLLSRQRAIAAATRKRYADARKNGYRGPVTRADLAAQCVRNQRTHHDSPRNRYPAVHCDSDSAHDLIMNTYRVWKDNRYLGEITLNAVESADLVNQMTRYDGYSFFVKW